MNQGQLLTLNLDSGAIWREETVGTSSTSLCLEYDKTVRLAGSLHYCKALEHQLATTTPVYNSIGNRIGLITTVNHVKDAMNDDEILHRILLWTMTLRFMVENQLERLRPVYSMSGDDLFSSKNYSAFNLPRFSFKVDNRESLLSEDPFTGILGESPPIKKIIKKAVRFASTENGILINGESGTGKEVFAKAIHEASGRKGSSVAINCAALPSNLIASELFGYAGGAFTGADSKGRRGKIELANNGTLFLDEIGDMPLEIQPTFLRVLEDKKVTPVGSNKDIQVDFRLIAATNCDLYQLVQEKKFRADLYYRLEVLQLILPPLRERGQDILLLANHFLEEICRKEERLPLKLSKKVEKFMLNHSWPGNVRQLKNAMAYAASICDGEIIAMEDLPASLFRDLGSQFSTGKIDSNQPIPSIQDTEEEMIRKALLITGNNVRAAAKMVGLSKTTVYRKIKDYNISI
ncbi:MAG: sigma 54-interacting transcriptional regulator [Desulfitobacterium sp.]|nr:sigma 54-interacting transcriptional regulator [Desulfitobacterium sp.]